MSASIVISRTDHPDKQGAGRGEHGWSPAAAGAVTVAGGVAWVSTIGSAVVAGRLQRAGMPVEATVALMSPEHRFAIGAGYLVAPLFVGLLGALADWALISPDTHTWRMPRRRGAPPLLRGRFHVRVALAVVTTLAGSVIGLVVLYPQLPLLFVAQCLTILLVVPFVFHHVGHAEDYRGPDERIVVFALVLGISGVLALLAERVFDNPPKFDEATVELDGRGPVRGAYVTTTGDAIVLITLETALDNGMRCPTLDAIPRERVVRVRVGPAQVEVEASSDCRKLEPPINGSS